MLVRWYCLLVVVHLPRWTFLVLEEPLHLHYQKDCDHEEVRPEQLRLELLFLEGEEEHPLSVEEVVVLPTLLPILEVEAEHQTHLAPSEEAEEVLRCGKSHLESFLAVVEELLMN